MVLLSEQKNYVPSGNKKQRNSRYIQSNIFHLTCVKLTTGLENFERRTFLSLQLRSTKIVG